MPTTTAPSTVDELTDLVLAELENPDATVYVIAPSREHARILFEHAARRATERALGAKIRRGFIKITTSGTVRYLSADDNVRGIRPTLVVITWPRAIRATRTLELTRELDLADRLIVCDPA